MAYPAGLVKIQWKHILIQKTEDKQGCCLRSISQSKCREDILQEGHGILIWQREHKEHDWALLQNVCIGFCISDIPWGRPDYTFYQIVLYYHIFTYTLSKRRLVGISHKQSPFFILLDGHLNPLNKNSLQNIWVFREKRLTFFTLFSTLHIL